MIIDTHQERGFTILEDKWNSDRCHFPLFDFLQPLTLEWMFAIYILMIIGALGITLGIFYRLSCLAFLVPYWYIFLLDTSAWNNHSYLYGLLGFLFLISDANNCWSVDAYKRNYVNEVSIPLWNYGLFRMQVFLVYFIAGLKKMHPDWIGGYSMRYLSAHWVFMPFRIFLTDDQVDYYVVHLFGSLFDLSIGFFLLFNRSRPMAMLFCATFNLMNSQLFNIGMFPFMMLATMPLFCEVDWPRNLLVKFWRIYYYWKLSDGQDQHSQKTADLKTKAYLTDGSIMDTDEQNRIPAFSKKNSSDTRKKSKIHFRQHFFAGLFLIYLSSQIFLPYSHFITKGYNHWTEGLYGYSWNMMVHSWQSLHTHITVKDTDNGYIFYLNPNNWVVRNRWSHHGRLAKQFAKCIQKKFAANGINHIEVYLDVWVSLNERVQQRIFDPQVDILTAKWSPFQETPWVTPVLSEFSAWRYAIKKMAEKYEKQSKNVIVIFLADFPGFILENYLHGELSNTTVKVLHGQILVEIPDEKQNVTLETGEEIQLPSEILHKIHVTSSTPACYTYISFNRTAEMIQEKQLQDHHRGHK